MGCVRASNIKSQIHCQVRGLGALELLGVVTVTDSEMRGYRNAKLF
jgi:hypothetical protein